MCLAQDDGWFCACESAVSSEYGRRTFVEQIPELIRKYRWTERPRSTLAMVGLALAGRAGARMPSLFGVSVSRSTVPRLVDTLPEPDVPAQRVVGIDEYAPLKGRVYGTVLVDCETSACPPPPVPARPGPRTSLTAPRRTRLTATVRAGSICGAGASDTPSRRRPTVRQPACAKDPAADGHRVSTKSGPKTQNCRTGDQPTQARQSSGHPLRQARLRLSRHRDRHSPHHPAPHMIDLRSTAGVSGRGARISLR